MYRKKTLRNMHPVTRRCARIINDLDSVTVRLKNLIDDIARMEMDSRALYRSLNAQRPTNEEAAALFDEDDQATRKSNAAETFYHPASELYDPALKDVDLTPCPEDLLRQQQEAADEL